MAARSPPGVVLAGQSSSQRPLACSLHIDQNTVTCALNLRSHHPALIDAGFAELETPIPWWDGRLLRFRFRFPPR
jgi:hypothetical protein